MSNNISLIAVADGFGLQPFSPACHGLFDDDQHEYRLRITTRSLTASVLISLVTKHAWFKILRSSPLLSKKHRFFVHFLDPLIYGVFMAFSTDIGRLLSPKNNAASPQPSLHASKTAVLHCYHQSTPAITGDISTHVGRESHPMLL